MKILFDLNIWIDIAIRPLEFPESVEAFKFAITNHKELYLPCCGITTIEYIIEKISPHKKKTFFDFIAVLIENNVSFAEFGFKELDLALQSKMSDFEDSCIMASAIKSKIDLIVTRNIKDFKLSPIEVMTPKSFLAAS